MKIYWLSLLTCSNDNAFNSFANNASIVLLLLLLLLIDGVAVVVVVGSDTSGAEDFSLFLLINNFHIVLSYVFNSAIIHSLKYFLYCGLSATIFYLFLAWCTVMSSIWNYQEYLLFYYCVPLLYRQPVCEQLNNKSTTKKSVLLGFPKKRTRQYP